MCGGNVYMYVCVECMWHSAWFFKAVCMNVYDTRREKPTRAVVHVQFLLWYEINNGPRIYAVWARSHHKAQECYIVRSVCVYVCTVWNFNGKHVARFGSLVAHQGDDKQRPRICIMTFQVFNFNPRIVNNIFQLFV